MRYKPQRILVTGGAGFIGLHFIDYMLKKYDGIFIVNLDSLTYASTEVEHTHDFDNKRYKFVKGNICDRILIDSLLEEFNIETIVNFAAETHVDRSINDPSLFIESNIIGTYTLLESARNNWITKHQWDKQQCRFHHISTDEVFGSLKINEPSFTEEHPYRPNSPYSASKASSDHIVRAYHKTYGLPTTVSHCSNNFGPFQHSEKFIPTVIRSCLQKKSIPIYGTGSNIRDWIYVKDHCYYIDEIIRNGICGESYNIGSQNELSNLDLVQNILHLAKKLSQDDFKYESLIEFVTDRAGHDFRYSMDITKLNSVSKKIETNFNENLVSTIKHYQRYL